ncbi:MAG: hypothetical protein RJQ10_08610 [Haliea sp.]|uniref:hypothetical protein n=1 Tax=Haliea sp. TaxID=1932666 RepID=UPI0032F06C08
MKTIMTTIAASTLLALLAGCAGTSGSSSSAATGGNAAQAVASNEGVTCKTVIKTGTRLGTRVCKKDEVWAQEAGDSRDAINDIQRNSAQSAGPAGG